MKLSKKEINQISEEFNLGKVKETSIIKGGNINHNFTFKTKKGDFVVRILGYELDERWSNKKDLQYKVTEYLIKNKFPYQIPMFIKSKNGGYNSRIGYKLVEVYPKIKGKLVRKLREHHIKELSKVLAIYHKTISKFRVPEKYRRLDNYGWIKSELENMKKVKPKNELDKLMLDNVNRFSEELEKRSNEIKKEGHINLIGHYDFGRWNVLFDRGKLVGVLDFENVSYGPKIKDFFLPTNKFESLVLFIKEYSKYNNLSKSEINSLISFKIIDCCYSLRWAYRGNMKRESDRMHHMKTHIGKFKNYLRFEKRMKEFLRSF